MTRILVYIVVLAALFRPLQGHADGIQLPQITQSLLKGIQQTGKKRIAVVDFVDLDGKASRLGKFIAEELSVELTQTAEGIEVVDRAHLTAIVQEHKLKSEGLLDPQTTKELGLLAGVDILVTGSITDLGDSIQIVAKALATDTARIVAASSGTLPKNSQVIVLLGGSVPEPAAANPNGTTTKRANDSEVKENSAAVAFGDLELEMVGCERQAAKIMCFGHLTNRSSRTKRVSFKPSSRMIDDAGNESSNDGQYSQYRMTIQVGSDRSALFCCLDKQIEPGIPLNLWIWGAGLSMKAASVSAVLETSEGTAVIKNIRLLTK